MAAQVAISAPEVKHETKTATLTPPASEESEHKNDGHETSSDLSDLEFDDDNEGTQREGAEEEGYKPDHYYGGGRIPVFKPVSLPLSGSAARCLSLPAIGSLVY